MRTKLRRSALYVPAANPRALAKARTLPADVVIVDLEDAVLPAAKEAARDGLRAAIGEGYGRRTLALRVNGPGTPWHEDDLRVAAALGVDAVLLPKLEEGAVVREVAAALAGLGAAGLPVWAMVETPLGLLRAPDLAEALATVSGAGLLVAGTADLARDLRASHAAGRAFLLPALAQIVLAARAFGLGVLDGVHFDLADDAGFEAACRQGRGLGFDGKTLIHPRTIEAANRIFGPDAEEIAAAERTLAAYDAAARAGQGVAVLDGHLVERLHADAARELLGLAAAIAGSEVFIENASQTK